MDTTDVSCSRAVPYAAAKAGIVQLTLNAAHALGRFFDARDPTQNFGMSVDVVLPG